MTGLLEAHICSLWNMISVPSEHLLCGERRPCLHNLFWPDPLNNAKDRMSPEPFWLFSLLSLTDGIKLILLGMDGDVEEKMPWSLELCREPCV